MANLSLKCPQPCQKDAIKELYIFERPALGLWIIFGQQNLRKNGTFTLSIQSQSTNQKQIFDCGGIALFCIIFTLTAD